MSRCVTYQSGGFTNYGRKFSPEELEERGRMKEFPIMTNKGKEYIHEDNIQAGDFIVLKEWDGKRYTGRQTWRRAKYVLRDVPKYGLCPGYCIVGW